MGEFVVVGFVGAGGGVEFVMPGPVPGIHVLLPFGEKDVDGRDKARPGRKPNSQDSAAILASVATVFMLRAVPVLATGMTSFDVPIPWS
jgi:hypothetical protein